MLDQDKNLTLISLSILIIALLDNVWILKGESKYGEKYGEKYVSYGESKSWLVLGL